MKGREGPGGITRRHRRLSDAETRERMLRTAIEMIDRDGLTVSLEHISFEAVIRAADVSRSTAYRHWQYKHQFYGDLVRELASSAGPPIVRDEISLIKQVLAEHEDRLATTNGRHRVMIELIRRLAAFDLDAILASPAWRTYHALCATVSGLTDSDLRDQVQAALAESENARIARIADAWRTLTGLFGYRLRPDLDTEFETLASVLSVAMHGLVVAAIAAPDVARREIVASPFDDGPPQRWSLSALSVAGTALTFLEPDPHAPNDEQHVAQVYRAIDEWASRLAGEASSRD
ncbi:TetR/AcrR family transcriptional regulator [Actinoplanes sp. GCM10030250]|uniref:TetR/AcrR family transcriptional regulator n=1 Tax=Actinoplanes sp. GCM10030250 TaxID=3273376 RepID=UPI0036230D1E